MSVGLIGFGRIGALLTRYFAPELDMHVYDVAPRPKEVRRLGAIPATLEEACRQEVVLLCVPMARLEEVARRIRRLVRPDALVIDVCSVKEYPVHALRRHLPKTVEILATHPNFGPDSAADSLRGHKVVLCPVRVSRERYGRVRRLLESKGLQLVELTPREHDRRMASSLVLTHFIGRALIRYGAEPTGVDTEGYKRLLRILQTVQNDTWQLFEDMNRYNRFAAPMRKSFLSAIRSVDRRLRR